VIATRSSVTLLCAPIVNITLPLVGVRVVSMPSMITRLPVIVVAVPGVNIAVSKWITSLVADTFRRPLDDGRRRPGLGGGLDIDQGTFSGGFNGHYAFSCSNGGVVHVNRSTFTKVTVATTNCELELRRSTFTNQMDGGLQIANGKVTIENNIFSNGGATPDDSTISNVLAGSTLRFNTFVAYDTSADRSGVALACDSSLAVSSNIFAYGQNAVVGCSPKYSLFDDARTMPANQNNVLATLPQIFVSPTDFHLSATSPARGKGEPGTDIGIDLEGNVRPAMPDIGAYQTH